MRTILIILFSFFILSNPAFAELDRTILLEEEVQKLTNKIEHLEHEINILKQHIPNLVQAHGVQTTEKIDTPSTLSTPASIPDSTKDISNIPLDKQKYDLALGKLKDKNYEQAKNLFAEFIESYPKSSMLDRALFWYAESYFGKKDFQNSALHYLKCYQKFPKGQKAQDALLKLAMSLGELNRKAEVCKIIKRLEAEFPNRSAAAKKTANDLKLKHSGR
jgi:tol-pal system protein YbgF